MIVLDASAVVELLLGGARGELVLGRLAEHEGEAHAPGLLDVEVLQVLRRLVSGSVISASRGAASAEILQELGIYRHPERPLLPRMWDLRKNLTAYDAAYVALSEALGCALATFDGKLAAAPGVQADVEVLGA
jgi:predicted nucleic acid-binding protein